MIFRVKFLYNDPVMKGQGRHYRTRILGGDIINMSTDYDCWREDEEPVSWEAVIKTFNENAAKVTELLKKAVKFI